MASLLLSCSLSGTPDAEDRQAAVLAVDNENARRLANGIALLPKSNASELRSSYQTIRSNELMLIHQQLVELAANKANQDAAFLAVKTKWNELTPQQRTAWLAFNP